MNGLEAIRLMEKGKIVVSEIDSTGEVFLTKIENNKIWWLFDYEYEGGVGEWKEEDSFNPTLEYKEYIEPCYTGWERVHTEGNFFVISDSEVIKCEEINSKLDVKDFEKANYFSTKEKAKEIDFKQTVFRKLQRFSDENGGGDIDWSDFNQRKYYIFYDTDDLIPDYCWKYTDKNFGVVYFVSKEVAKQAVELFHDDLIKYFTM